MFVTVMEELLCKLNLVSLSRYGTLVQTENKTNHVCPLVEDSVNASCKEHLGLGLDLIFLCLNIPWKARNL